MNTLVIEQYPLHSVRFWKAYIITMRPYLMFVSGVTGIVGMSFAPEIGVTKTILIFLSSFLSYGFGQALTDCFQIDTDSISSPYRPLTQGVVNRNYFLVISSVGVFLCVSLLAFFNPINIILGVLAGFGLITYTDFKKKWWAGPFYNTWIVLVLFMMSYLAAQGNIYFDFSNPVFLTACLVIFFGYSNFVLTGYFKDIEADRKTSYKTLPVVYGRKKAAAVSDLFGKIICIAVIVMVVFLAFDSFPYQSMFKALLFIYGGICATIIIRMNLAKVNSDSEAHKAIVPSVHSYILLLSGITTLNKPDWFLSLLLFYLLYIIIMKTRPEKEQI